MNVQRSVTREEGSRETASAVFDHRDATISGPVESFPHVREHAETAFKLFSITFPYPLADHLAPSVDA